MHVEVLQREEVEEKMLMTPGDIVMMLNEMGGMRVQTTSPSLGAASVRVQGMRGRYTSFLSDGLPLFGQQGAGLGLLQIPPTGFHLRHEFLPRVNFTMPLDIQRGPVAVQLKVAWIAVPEATISVR